MDSNFGVRWVRLVALAFLVYGLIIFANEGAGELFARGNAFVVSQFIWGSSWVWPDSGVAASVAFLMAMTAFFIIRFKPKDTDFSSEIDYVWTFLRALFDTLLLSLAWCLAWTVSVFIFEPIAMSEQLTEYLLGTGITNTFVMYFSAMMLGLLWALKLRRQLFGWLPPFPTSRRFNLGIRLLPLSLGAVIFRIALSYTNPFYFLGLTANGYVYCYGDCYSRLAYVGVGWVSGLLLMLVGAMTLIENLFPSKAALYR
jgi:hypothetical protein